MSELCPNRNVRKCASLLLEICLPAGRVDCGFVAGHWAQIRQKVIQGDLRPQLDLHALTHSHSNLEHVVESIVTEQIQ